MFKNVQWSVLWFFSTLAFTLMAVVGGVWLSGPKWSYITPTTMAIVSLIEFGLWVVCEDRLKKLLVSLPFGLPRKERWKWFQQQQPVVDRILRERAFAFNEQCEREKEAMNDPKTDLAKIAETTRSLKYHFWSAHDTFKRFGFKVKVSHKDYLPKPESKNV